MMSSNFRIRPRSWLYLLTMLLYGLQLQAQCDSIIVDLSGYPPDYTINLGEIRRNNQCCGAGNNFNCLRFVVYTNPDAAAIRLYTSATSWGSEYWSYNCGSQFRNDTSACLVGAGPHRIVFCKPGSDGDAFFIEQIARPTVPEADSVRLGCSRELDVYGMAPGTITWTSITGTLGQYNGYLSNPNVAHPLFTPDSLAPAFIDYRVCGSPFAEASQCGAISICDTQRVYVFPRLTAVFDPSAPSFCNTGPGSGVSVSVTPSGGLNPYTYQWYSPTGAAIDTDSIVFANIQGTYNVDISDRLTRDICVPVRFGVPVQVFSNPTVTATADITVCATAPSGTVSASFSNTTGIQWFGGAGTYTPSNTAYPISYTPTALEIANGFVDIYVQSTSSGVGCNIAYDTVRINFIDTVTVDITASPISCYNDLSTITATADGGVAPYAYQWNIGLNTSSITQGPGNYVVSVTDASGYSCQAMSDVTVTAPSAMGVVMASTDVSGVGLCDGDATALVLGGTAPYTYLWNDGQVTETAIALCYGIHQVTVTDDKGCTITGSVVVNNPLCNSLVVNVLPDVLLCNGNTNGTLHAIVSGGTPDYTYIWSTNPAQTTETIIGLSGGAYNVTVTDAAGCVQIAVGVVLEPEALDNFFSSVNVSTIDGNEGEATVHVSGGTLPYNYVWSNGATSVTATGLSVGPAPLRGMMYFVTITDGNGCSLVDSIYITQPPCNSLVLGVLTTDLECFADNDGEATVYGIGGVAPYTYNWNPGGFTTATVTGLTSGSYAVTVSDKNVCIQFINFNIQSPNQLNVVLTPTNVSCFDLLDGTIETTVTGGTFPYYFKWSNYSNAEDLAYLHSGVYSVTVVDANGCSFTASTTVSQPDDIVLNSFLTHVSCFGAVTVL